MQNKANVKMGKMTISTATIKAYANEQRAMNNKRYSKQTQSNPISDDQSQFHTHKHLAPLATPQIATALGASQWLSGGEMGGNKMLAGSSQRGLEWLYFWRPPGRLGGKNGAKGW